MTKLELRYVDGWIDELVAEDAKVHLEDLGGSWMLIVENAEGRVHIELRNKRSEVIETEGAVTEHRS